MGLLQRFRRGERSASAPDSTGKKAAARPRNPITRFLKRQYEAGETDRLTHSWGTMPMTADDIVRRNQRVLVARSREQCSNNDYAKAFLRMLRQNVVGPRGVILQAQSRDPSGKLDKRANEAIEQGWREWGKARNCDVSGRQSWRSIQASCASSAGKDGEFMVRMIFGRDAGPWGFALQVLDPQRCPPDFDVEQLDNGRFIRHGIEFNQYGRPLAYYFSTTKAEDSDYQYGGRGYIRVPADEIIHGFLPEIVGQKRGLPWTATALWRMRMLNGFENAALVNARASAAKGGWLTWKEGYGPSDEDNDQDDVEEMDVEAGTYQVLAPGLEAQEHSPQYPSGEHQVFTKSMLRGMSAGWGVSYNNLANDLESVNYSSLRQGALDERENWKELQEWFIEEFVEVVFEAWLPRAVLAGRLRVNGKPLRPDRLDKYREVQWLPRRWQWVDPLKEVRASVESKNNMLTNPGQILREQGHDPDTVWRNFAQDIQAMRDAGIPDEFINASIFGSAEPAGGPSVSGEGDGTEQG